MSINEKQLATELARKHQLTVKECREIINDLEDMIIKAVVMGQKVLLHRFGRFERKIRKGRMGIHPRTFEPFPQPDIYIPKFTASQIFKNVVKSKDE